MVQSKTKEKEYCIVCDKQWGTSHIMECPMLHTFRNTIAKWRADGYMRPDLYSNSTQLKKEGEILSEAYSTIIKHMRGTAI